ncbi:MAG: hypothetical protein H7Z11_16115 [Verrucomicrobia bacterium]|nr:hypothetical protein [Leptolyngbya sp. ES-bin-22]
MNVFLDEAASVTNLLVLNRHYVAAKPTNETGATWSTPTQLHSGMLHGQTLTKPKQFTDATLDLPS